MQNAFPKSGKAFCMYDHYIKNKKNIPKLLLQKRKRLLKPKAFCCRGTIQMNFYFGTCFIHAVAW
jgi:hypothetical protein